MSEFVLSEINVFPVKSLGGIKVQQSTLTDRGLELDRRWMLVDPSGAFLTQRELPTMALLNVWVHDDHLLVTHALYPDRSLVVPLVPDSKAPLKVAIWKDECPANQYSKQINSWFSEQLDKECRLVHMPDDSRRTVDEKFQRVDQPEKEIVSFADGFPSLIIGESSLTDLNERLNQSVSMDRFRTNFVFTGGEPYAEDGWNQIRIGSVEFRVVKPCARCSITTVDPATAEKGVEPLQTLATYRRKPAGGVMFGQNLLHNSIGTIEVGMPIEVL